MGDFVCSIITISMYKQSFRKNIVWISPKLTEDADVFLYIISFYKLVWKQKSENIEFIVGCCEYR